MPFRLQLAHEDDGTWAFSGPLTAVSSAAGRIGVVTLLVALYEVNVKIAAAGIFVFWPAAPARR